MEPIKTYEYLVLSRQRVLDWTRPLGAGAYTRVFPIGRGSLAGTLTHIMTSEWYYVARMQQHAVPPYEQWPIQEEKPPPFAALEGVWAEQAAHTRAALRAVRDWNAPLEYEVTQDDGLRVVVTASAADIATQLILHEVHHRAQAMNMLRHLGVTIDDIDFNTLMYKRRPVALR
jgi:uncharacterized damage-inducible protein DinB